MKNLLRIIPALLLLLINGCLRIQAQQVSQPARYGWTVKTDLLGCAWGKGQLAVERKILPGLSVEVKGAFIHNEKARIIHKDFKGGYFKSGIKYYLPMAEFKRQRGSSQNAMRGSYLRFDYGFVHYKGYRTFLETPEYFDLLNEYQVNYDVKARFWLLAIGHQGFIGKRFVIDNWVGFGAGNLGVEEKPYNYAERVATDQTQHLKGGNNYAYFSLGKKFSVSAGLSFGVVF